MDLKNTYGEVNTNLNTEFLCIIPNCRLLLSQDVCKGSCLQGSIIKEELL